MTHKEKILEEITVNYKIEADLHNILGFLGDRLFSIKCKGGGSWDEATESYVLKEVLKEGVQFYFEKKLKAALAGDAKSASTEHLLVANPSQWPNLFPNIPLDNFNESAMKDLMSRSYFVLPKFITYDHAKTACKEFKHLERESRFERGYKNHILTKEKYMDF